MSDLTFGQRERIGSHRVSDDDDCRVPIAFGKWPIIWSVEKTSVRLGPRPGFVVVEFRSEKRAEPVEALSIGLGERGITVTEIRTRAVTCI